METIMKQLDILLVSMPRSGSTMLANLMTYGNNWTMCEPHNRENRIKSWIPIQARAFGRQLKPCDFQNLAKQMKDFERWGIKEIHKRHYIPVNEQLTPTHYIILLRDAGDVFLSLRNFYYTRKDSHQKLYDTIVEWWYDLHQFAKSIPSKQTTILYYDDLLDEQYRRLLARQIKWPLNGQPDTWLEHYNRQDEKRNNQIKRRIQTPTNTDLDYMDRVRKMCKKVLLSTLLIQDSSVMVVEDILQGDKNV